MIKSLFEPDEHPSEEIKTGREEATANEPAIEKLAEPQYVEVNEAENLFDAPEENFEKNDDLEEPLSAGELESLNAFIETTGEKAEFSVAPTDSTKNLFEETSGETTDVFASQFDLQKSFSVEPINETTEFTPSVETVSGSEPVETKTYDLPADTAATSNYDDSAGTLTAETSAEPKIEVSKPVYNNDLLFQPLPEPESFTETARKSGLAYAAAITLTASIIFMLVIGWFADLLFGTSPWGIVGGIVLGSLIGFVQFFRMTAQIFKNKE